MDNLANPQTRTTLICRRCEAYQVAVGRWTDKIMKICLFTDCFLPGIGGAEIAVHNIAKTFFEMGHEPVVVTYNRRGLRNFQFPYLVETIRPIFYRIGLKTFIEKRAICHFHKKHNFDIINVHKTYAGYATCKVKDKLNVPIVITAHGGDVQKNDALGYGKRTSPKWEKKISYSVRKADALIAIGSNTSRCFMELGADENDIFRIPNGIDTEYLNKKADLDIADLGVSCDDKIILAVGKNYSVKGFETILKAVSKLKYNNYKLIIIGRWTDQLIPLAEQLGIRDRFVPLREENGEFIKGQDVKFPSNFLLALYQNADVFVSSSLLEGFSLACIEAMATGLPMVLTKCPGNEDVFEADGQGGFYVPVGDSDAMANKIKLLLRDDKLREQFSKFNRIYSKEKYDINVICRQYIDLFRKEIEK